METDLRHHRCFRDGEIWGAIFRAGSRRSRARLGLLKLRGRGNEAAEAGEGGAGFAAFGFDEVEQLGGGTGVFLGFAVWVYGFEIVNGIFDGFGFAAVLAG